MLPTWFSYLPYGGLVLLAFVHLVFAYSEMFDWERAAREKLGMEPEKALVCAPLAYNQGLYNAFLAAGAIWAMIAWYLGGPASGRPLATFFAVCAIVAGLVGWRTFNRTGFLSKQSLPGLLALLLAWLPLS